MVTEFKLPPMTLDQIREKIADADGLEVFLNKAQTGGLDVSDRKEKLRVAKGKVMKIKNAFYPNDIL